MINIHMGVAMMFVPVVSMLVLRLSHINRSMLMIIVPRRGVRVSMMPAAAKQGMQQHREDDRDVGETFHSVTRRNSIETTDRSQTIKSAATCAVTISL